MEKRAPQHPAGALGARSSRQGWSGAVAHGAITIRELESGVGLEGGAIRRRRRGWAECRAVAESGAGGRLTSRWRPSRERSTAMTPLAAAQRGPCVRGRGPRPPEHLGTPSGPCVGGASTRQPPPGPVSAARFDRISIAADRWVDRAKETSDVEHEISEPRRVALGWQL
jgi:hypothetical protein